MGCKRLQSMCFIGPRDPLPITNGSPLQGKDSSQIALSARTLNGRRQTLSILSELCIMHFVYLLIYALITSYIPPSPPCGSLLSPDCN